MVIVDANLLIYAYDTASPFHAAAREWVEAAFTGRERIGLPWAVILAFVRITTHPRLSSTPFTMREAAAIVEEWLQAPSVIPVDAGPDHWRILVPLLEQGQVRSHLTMDAHLAALALEHGATLATHDRGFARFPGLRVTYPLLP